MNTIDILNTALKPTWCPGCGNFGIWTALKNALGTLSIPPKDTVFVYGVGCHGNMRDFVWVYGVEGLHGRALPLAQGIKLANTGLTVIAIVGDGDCLGEGGNHFIHAAKRNPNITVVIHDNEVYGLTTGQASPTAEKGFVTKTTPEGAFDEPVHPLALSLISGGTFVARGFAGDIPHLTDVLAQGISHKGFSVVDVIQPCVTFDHVHTYQWFRERIYKQEQVLSKKEAMEKSLEWGEKIPVGVFYKEDRPTSEEREGAIEGKKLIELPLGIPAREEFLSLFR